MDLSNKTPFSIVFQLLQECPFECGICHRRFSPREQRLNIDERKQLVSNLMKLGLKRLTVTGGEPTVLGHELYDFLKYVHTNKIHLSLSTSGHKLDISQIEDINNYVDHLLIPIRALNIKDFTFEYGNTPYTQELLETVVNLLQWIKSTGILLEVSTVVHKQNINKIMDLGWELLNLNANIIWRIEEYYTMGIRGHLKNQFELTEGEFDRLFELIDSTFGKLFKMIRANRANSRIIAPDYLITPSGDLVNTSDNRYSAPKWNVLTSNLPDNIKTRRPWSDYKSVCRDWGW